MGWPVRDPGRQCAWLSPHSSDTCWPVKLATHTLLLPSTAIPHGIVRPPPVNGAGAGTPSEWIRITEGVPLDLMAPLGQGTDTAAEFATHMLPWLSAAIPIGLFKP